MDPGVLYIVAMGTVVTFTVLIYGFVYWCLYRVFRWAVRDMYKYTTDSQNDNDDVLKRKF